MNYEELDTLDLQEGDRVLECPLARQRSEMLRQFKAGFFATLNHDLRSPINTQISSLEIVLADLHESRAEMREFISEAQKAAKRHLELIEACIAVGKYCPPIQPLQPRSQALLPILQRVHQLTHLQARTRLVSYEPLTEAILSAQVTAWVDAAGLEQALLGLLSWTLACLSRGCLSLTVAEEAGAINLQWEMTGEISDAVREEERASNLTWFVAGHLLAAMQGQATLVPIDESEPRHAIQIRLAKQQTE